ncbi:MAG: hypothetical protein D6798_17720 [Deltaproteobacteria bacterium]|nr:MAG: hypothetical protein D6798_17720 [Deltaproteobacteria bacterium]
MIVVGRRLLRSAFTAVVRWRVWRDLGGVWVRGLADVEGLRSRGPVLFAANHVCWWDAMLLPLLDAPLGGRGRVLMDAANLARLPYFGALGALRLDSSDLATVRAGLRSAVTVLDGPGDSLWIFPQGRQVPVHRRPLGLRRGVHHIARSSGAPAVPVSLYYGWGQGPRPVALVEFGPPLVAGTRSAFMAELEARLVAGLDAAEAALAVGPAQCGYAPLVHGRQSSPETGLGSRLLQVLWPDAGGPHA